MLTARREAIDPRRILAGLRDALPSTHLVGDDRLSADRKPRILIGQAFGESLEKSFSGTTFYLARAGMETGLLDGCVSLYSVERPARDLQVRAALWKAAQTLRHQPSQGYKFVEASANHLWKKHIARFANTTVISNFQIFGRYFRDNRRRYNISSVIYIDGSLDEYFDTYAVHEASGLSPKVMQEAIAAERKDFADADLVVTMSRRSREHLIARHGVDSGKIHVLPPGANLDDRLTVAESSPSPSTDAFAIGFVGMYPERKGLPTLAAAVGRLVDRGHNLTLTVIGRCPDDIARRDYVRYLGVIDKRTDQERFIAALRSVDLGCLLSEAELAGISTVEFLRVGVPVLGTAVGGSTDILEQGGCVMLGPRPSVEAVEAAIETLLTDRARYDVLKTAAAERYDWCSWRRAARQIDNLMRPFDGLA